MATTLIVDTKGLVYDATNKRVGIGTANPAAKLDVSGGYLRVRNDLNSNAYYQFEGVHQDGRQQLMQYSGGSSIRILSANAVSASAVLGPSFGINDTAGQTGPIAFTNSILALTAFSVGGLANVSTHRSLAIGTPTVSWQTGFGGGTNVDIATFSDVSNTWGGVRPSLRYTAFSHEFRLDGGTGLNNPGITVLVLSGSNVGIGGVNRPGSKLSVSGSVIIGNNIGSTSAKARLSRFRFGPFESVAVS